MYKLDNTYTVMVVGAGCGERDGWGLRCVSEETEIGPIRHDGTPIDRPAGAGVSVRKGPRTPWYGPDRSGDSQHLRRGTA